MSDASSYNRPFFDIDSLIAVIGKDEAAALREIECFAGLGRLRITGRFGKRRHHAEFLQLWANVGYESAKARFGSMRRRPQQRFQGAPPPQWSQADIGQREQIPTLEFADKVIQRAPDGAFHLIPDPKQSLALAFWQDLKAYAEDARVLWGGERGAPDEPSKGDALDIAIKEVCREHGEPVKKVRWDRFCHLVRQKLQVAEGEHGYSDRTIKNRFKKLRSTE